MSWWEKLKRSLGGSSGESDVVETPESPSTPKTSTPAAWLAADQSRFGVPVLDFTPIIGNITSFSGDPAAAAKAVSWSASTGEGLSGDIVVAHTHPCTLRYPAAADLPDGLLYTPHQMEDKWVVAWRNGQIRMARSWTGAVVIVADTRREGDVLVVTEIRATEESLLEALGDPVETFDWMMRTYALTEVNPLPVSPESARLLETTPLLVFNMYGHHALCAARTWNPPPPERALRSDGAMLLAVRAGDLDTVRQLNADGESLNSPSIAAGYTPLFASVIQGNEAMTALLLELGADPNIQADRAITVLGIGIAYKAPQSLLALLVKHGADHRHANADGFGLLHAAAEAGRPDLVEWLVSLGLDLEATTRHGHAALHIAAALGKVSTIEALLAAGARLDAPSPGGTPREVAEAEGKPESAAVLDRHSPHR